MEVGTLVHAAANPATDTTNSLDILFINHPFFLASRSKAQPSHFFPTPNKLVNEKTCSEITLGATAVTIALPKGKNNFLACCIGTTRMIFSLNLGNTNKSTRVACHLLYKLREQLTKQH
jgi:hypothetical protein